jgi:hypothetical protein
LKGTLMSSRTICDYCGDDITEHDNMQLLKIGDKQYGLEIDFCEIIGEDEEEYDYVCKDICFDCLKEIILEGKDA